MHNQPLHFASGNFQQNPEPSLSSSLEEDTYSQGHMRVKYYNRTNNDELLNTGYIH